MFNSLLIDPPVLRSNARTANRAPRVGLLSRFQALLESLVEASARQSNVDYRSYYRFPPF